MVNDTLNKSLAALDAAADELLKKSNSDDKDDDVKPDDVSDDKGDDKDLEKCDNKPDGDNLAKSEDSDDDDDDSDEGEDTEKSVDDIQSDLIREFQQDEDITKGMATSEFQAALVAATAKALSDMQYDMHNVNQADNKATTVLAKSLQAVIASNQQLRADNDKLARRVSKLEKSLDKGIESILEAVDGLSTQPAHMRKSVNSINVHEKDFAKSVSGTGNSSFDSLTKSQVMSILTNELYANNPEVRPADIISYESGAPLRQELQTLVASKCK